MIGPLVVVTDRRMAAAAGHDLVDVVAAAVGAGATAVLLREKDLPPGDRRRLADRLRAVTAEAGAALLVASDVGLAAAVGADGVHLAAADPWPPAGGPAAGLAVGRSCHTVDDLREAARRGAAYATYSPVFATASKPGYGPALGLDGLASGCRAIDGTGLAVVALGGIGPGRARGCREAGAAGVAVMGEVMRATDPADVTRRLAAEAEVIAARDGAR